jgi:hypothetical protein
MKFSMAMAASNMSTTPTFLSLAVLQQSENIAREDTIEIVW